jgi:hypothetical protein
MNTSAYGFNLTAVICNLFTGGAWGIRICSSRLHVSGPQFHRRDSKMASPASSTGYLIEGPSPSYTPFLLTLRTLPALVNPVHLTHAPGSCSPCAFLPSCVFTVERPIPNTSTQSPNQRPSPAQPHHRLTAMLSGVSPPADRHTHYQSTADSGSKDRYHRSSTYDYTLYPLMGMPDGPYAGITDPHVVGTLIEQIAQTSPDPEFEISRHFIRARIDWDAFAVEHAGPDSDSDDPPLLPFVTRVAKTPRALSALADHCARGRLERKPLRPRAQVNE